MHSKAVYYKVCCEQTRVEHMSGACQNLIVLTSLTDSESDSDTVAMIIASQQLMIIMMAVLWSDIFLSKSFALVGNCQFMRQWIWLAVTSAKYCYHSTTSNFKELQQWGNISLGNVCH